jgi:hypothetical protein
MLPVVLLAVPIYNHFHSAHSWLEGKVRDDANTYLAPDRVTDISCDVKDTAAQCSFTTESGHRFSVHVTRNGDTWSPDRAVQLS